MKPKIKAGSRSSSLAKAQVNEIFSLLEESGVNAEHELRTYGTKGDRDQKTPLTASPADDFFTDTLDEALLNKEIDVAIHSAKDLPETMREGLAIIALTHCLDDTDALIGKKLSALKPGDKVGTSSLLRQKELQVLKPRLKAANIRGNVEARIKLLKDGKYDAVIIATCALRRLGMEGEIAEILPWEGKPLQGQLVVVARADDTEIKEMFEAIDVRRNYGKVSLVGAGPGDPDLITLKAIKVLKKCDCIFYDYLAHKDLMDYAPYAEKIYVGKRKDDHSLSQAELSQLLKKEAMAGKHVVRLKGGDPFLFGRGADEQEYLRAFHIKVEVVPGVSSATGIPAGMGIPLTARGISSSVSFVSAHGEGDKNRTPARIEIPKADTIVFLMGLTRLDIIIKSLLKSGWKKSTPIIVIMKGTRINERIVVGTLQDIRKKMVAEKPTPPALIVVGEVVKFLRKDLRERDNILYLGTNPEKYKPLGRIIHHPMIDISPIILKEKDIDQLFKEFEKTDIVLLTSRFSVRCLLGAVKRSGKRAKNTPEFAVIGEDTAFVLGQYGITPRVVAPQETSVGMVEALEGAYTLKGKKILFPRSALSNPYLKEALTKKGAKVNQVAIYQNTKPPKKALPEIPINKILFTSPSTVKNFLQDYGRIPPEWKIVSKGPRTQESLKRKGYASEIVVFD